MTSVWKGLGLGLAVIVAASITAAGATKTAKPEHTQAAAAQARPAPPAPQYIRDRIIELGQGFDGRVGIAVVRCTSSTGIRRSSDRARRVAPMDTSAADPVVRVSPAARS